MLPGSSPEAVSRGLFHERETYNNAKQAMPLCVPAVTRYSPRRLQTFVGSCSRGKAAAPSSSRPTVPDTLICVMPIVPLDHQTSQDPWTSLALLLSLFFTLPRRFLVLIRSRKVLYGRLSSWFRTARSTISPEPVFWDIVTLDSH